MGIVSRRFNLSLNIQRSSEEGTVIVLLVNVIFFAEFNSLCGEGIFASTFSTGPNPLRRDIREIYLTFRRSTCKATRSESSSLRKDHHHSTLKVPFCVLPSVAKPRYRTSLLKWVAVVSANASSANP